MRRFYLASSNLAISGCTQSPTRDVLKMAALAAGAKLID